MKKRILSILLVALMLMSLLPVTALAVEYTDTKGHWGERPIDRWSDYGVVSGKGDGVFDPDGLMKRGEAAQVFANLFRLTAKGDLSDYIDVGLGKWYDDAIAKCVKAGILSGKGEGVMDPEGTITREEFFTMFARALGIEPETAAKIAVADGAQAASWAAGYITALVNRGYVKGTGSADGGVAVQPKLNINRASVMSLMDQTIDTYVNTTEKVTAGDGLTLIVTDNANVTFAKGTESAEVYVFGKNAAVTKAPVGTVVTTSEDATGTRVNGKAFSKDATTVVEKEQPSSGGGSYTPPAPETPLTVADILPEGFPSASGSTPPDNAWVSDSNKTFKDTASNSIVFAGSGSPNSLPLTTELVKDGNNYKYTEAPTTCTFVMNGGALSSIIFEDGSALSGTYTAPPTYTVTFATVTGGAVYNNSAGTGSTVTSITVYNNPAVTTNGNKITIGGTDYYAVAATNYALSSFGSVPSTITADTTVTPAFAPTYTVTFDLNGISGTAPAEQTIGYGEKATAPTPAPTDAVHTFNGWYKTKDPDTGALSDQWNFNSNTVTEDVTLYAKWTRTVGSIIGEGFPTASLPSKIPENAWKNANEAAAFIYNEELFFKKSTSNESLDLGDYAVKQGDKYVAADAAFNMTGGKLTSIEYTKSGTGDLIGTYTAPLPAGALKGVFSVSATKKVRFSQGNLQATYDSSASTYTWGFAANQYDCIGNAAGNTTINSQTNGAVVDLFGWSTSNNGGTSTTDNYGINTSITDSYYYGDFYDWGKAVGDGNTWRTLTTAEWQYLFNTRTMTNGKVRYSDAVSSGVTIGDATYKGVFLYPDDYNGEVVSSSMTWDEINAAGIVFLPAVGFRGGSVLQNVGSNGYYWSSTDYNVNFAYCVYFSSSNVKPGSQGRCCNGCSVRLVTEVDN